MRTPPGMSNDPIQPEELRRLKRVYEIARDTTALSRYDPAAERLAAMAIRFYQLGIRDEATLIDKIVNASTYLRQN